MALTWIPENPPRWDADKAAIVGGAPEGVFSLAPREGELLPGDWWRAEQDGRTVGYGWMDVTWGYAPVLLAVAPDAQAHGVGSYIVEQLAHEAHKRGLAYIFNVIAPTHPDGERVAAWLGARGFEAAEGDWRMLRRRVG